MTKEIRIKIGEPEELDKEISDFFDKPVGESSHTFFLTPQQFSQIFSKGRVEVLRSIEKQEPKSMGELVARLKRPKESVSRDLNMLSRAGLIEISTNGLYRSPKIVSRELRVSF
jgi:predicted transcriptional regulator